jgi:3-deoxy-D-manno-octulosonate 8-phosphate phosphatase (KDO 8-P phosphatase)
MGTGNEPRISPPDAVSRAGLRDEAAARAARVRVMIFDVDGVLTDGRLYYTSAGETIKAFDVRDGQGMKLLASTGVRLAIISGRRSEALQSRARDLGIAELHQGVEDKLAAFNALLARWNIEANAVGFAGDDYIDLPVLARCGFAASVPDAPALVQARAHFVTQARGGRGAGREICEAVMQAQGTLEAALARYLT